MNDHQAEEIVLAALTLAVVLRDEGRNEVLGAAQQVLEAAGGDPLAAIATLAALLDVERPVDAWWQQRARPFPHGTHAGFARHKRADEDPCAACIEGERQYQAARHVRRYARKGIRAA